MLVPRHPERFAEVAALIEGSGLRWARRGAARNPDDAQCEVILLDSIGELRSVYPLAEIVFVGGSIAQTGGHNIIEPATAGAAVVTGAHTFNFQMIVETFLKAGAIVQLPPLPNLADSEATLELANAISELLADPARRLRTWRARAQLVNENRGATERTIQSLTPILQQPANVIDPAGSLSCDAARQSHEVVNDTVASQRNLRRHYQRSADRLPARLVFRRKIAGAGYQHWQPDNRWHWQEHHWWNGFAARWRIA